MKTAITTSILTYLLMIYCAVLPAQEETLSRDFKESTIGELSTLMNNFYVEPDLAFQVSEHLKQQLEAGHFDGVSGTIGFSESLTKEVQSISQDKHLLIRPLTATQGARPTTTADFLARHRVRITRDREDAGGIKGVGILEGNGGDLRFGLPWQSVSDGHSLQHLPRRLTVMIQAPREKVQAIMNKHESVNQLIQNQWVSLMVLDEANWYRWAPTHGWSKIE